MFNRESIKQRLVNSVKKIEIKGWGEAYIRQWSGSERVAYMKASSDIKTDGEIDVAKVMENQFTLVAVGLCDEEGKRLYCDNEISELPKEIKAEVIEQLFVEISAHNGLEVSEVKEEIKNSETTQKSDS